MIRPEELRIGNWLYWNKKTPRQVTPSTFGLSDYELETQYSPIPLSPEILEKCGFEKMIRQDDYILDKWMRVTYIHLTGNFCYALGNGSNPPSMKHLHQLQNLYHALTNQELIINL